MPDAKQDVVKRLTDDEVANIRFDLVNSKPSPSPMGLFRQHCEDLLAEHDALCATVWALQEKYDSLKSKIAWHRDGVGPDVPVLRERYDKLIATNTALREQLALAEHASEEFKRLAEGEITRLRDELAQVTQRALHIENCKDCQACWEGSQP